MFKEKLGNMKNALMKTEKNDNKKSIENLIVLAVVLVITIIAINYIWNGKSKKKNNTVQTKVLAVIQLTIIKMNWSKNLKKF